MENPFDLLEENIRKELKEIESRLLFTLKPLTESRSEVFLEKFIHLKKAASDLGIASKTLASYKGQIDHVKRFGKIFFLKDSLMEFMENGISKPREKRIMRTRIPTKHQDLKDKST